jgi:hypothetical protein
MQLTYNLFIQMFMLIKKPTSQILLYEVGYQLWAQLDSNQRPLAPHASKSSSGEY